MKIVIDGRMLLPQMTGVGRYILGLARGLCSLPGDDQFELWLQQDLPASHPVWSFASDRLRIRKLTLRHMELRQQWALPAKVRRSRPDLLHYPHFDLPWLIPGKVVATIHDLKYIARPDFFPHTGRLKRLAMLAMMRFTTRRASQVITDSQSTRQDLIRWLSVPPQKVSVVHLGVDETHLQPVQTEQIDLLRKRYGLGEHLILFVGERRPHKNIHGLLKAFSALQAMVDQPYQLVIAGKAYADYREPEALTESLGLQDWVRFLDYLPDGDLPLLYQAAQAFCLLSYYEGFGLPVLESMAAGTPVITSDLTSLPEAAGQAGLLVPADEPEQAALALKSILPGGEKRQECISRGLEHARQFTWERCASQTLAVYHQAVSRR